MIVKRADGYYLLSKSKGKDGNYKKLGGPYKTREAAVQREREVRFFRHRKGG